MISYQAAQAIIWKEVTSRTVEVETVPLVRAIGRVLAADIKAPLAIQPFDNSAMDGFAVNLADFQELPVVLSMAQTIAAGDVPDQTPYKKGTCCAVMTGAMLPPWADAVVPVEQVVRNGTAISFSQTPRQGDHIRRMGQDFNKDEAVLVRGTPLTTAHIMPLAVLGLNTVTVYKRPNACFIATGRELVPMGTKHLPPAKIFNSNLPYAEAILPLMGVDCLSAEVVADDADAFLAVVSQAVAEGCDMIISSGAVSAGSFDFIRTSLEQMGATILFHKAAIKPGKPILFAKFPNGVFYFGLPGNPAATAAGLRFFVQPFLDAYYGVKTEQPQQALLQTPLNKQNDLGLFLKARLETDETGMRRVWILEGQESFMTNPFLQMNAWAVIPEQAGQLEKEAKIEVYPLLRN